MDFAKRINVYKSLHMLCRIHGGGWRKVNTLPSQACMANRDESWTITHFILYLLPKENDTTT